MPSCLLRLNTTEKDVNSISNSNCNISFNNSPHLQSITNIVLKSAQIPNVFYTIRTGVNDTFTYRISGTPTTVSIPQGIYNITTLRTALQTAIGLGFNYTQSTLTNKLTFTTTTAIQFLGPTLNRMATVLGIITGSNSDTTTFTAEGLPDLSGVQTVYLASHKLADGASMIDARFRGDSIIACIPITVPFGAIEHYTTDHSEIDDVDYKSQRLGVNLQSIDLRLYDHLGNILDLQGHHLNIIFKVFYS